jgi:hypothetical protein
MNAFDIRDVADLSDRGWKEEYDEMIDNCHGSFMDFDASTILEECDPTAYEIGFSEWVDSLPKPWECGNCGDRYDTDDEAIDCCMEPCSSCGELYETTEEADDCCESEEDEPPAIATKRQQGPPTRLRMTRNDRRQ